MRWTAPPLSALLLGLLCSVSAAQDAGPFELIGTVKHEPANEISGIAKSGTYANTFWVHNDSGDKPRLFAIKKTGQQIMPEWLRKDFYTEKKEKGKKPWRGFKIHLAANIDWEDITIGGGKIYISAMGNNGNSRRDIGVYVVNEPDPNGVGELRIQRFFPVRYPDQKKYPAEKWHFDCESMFWSKDKLYFLTKHRVTGKHNRGEAGTKLYRLDTAHTDRENVLTLVQARGDLVLPTGADIAPNGRLLAVLTLRAVWVFERPDKGDAWLSGKAWFLPLPVQHTKQAEAITWDDNATLLIANEQREIFRLKRKALKEHR